MIGDSGTYPEKTVNVNKDFNDSLNDLPQYFINDSLNDLPQYFIEDKTEVHITPLGTSIFMFVSFVNFEASAFSQMFFKLGNFGG